MRSQLIIIGIINNKESTMKVYLSGNSEADKNLIVLAKSKFSTVKKSYIRVFETTKINDVTCTQLKNISV